MDSDKVQAKCGQCGTELKESDKECRKCGSTKKVFAQAVGGGTVSLEGSVNRKHVTSWDGKSISILALIMAAIFPPAVYGIFELLPVSPWLKIVIWVLVVAVLGLIGFWKRYPVLMFIRWLGRKFPTEKTYRGK